MIQDPAEVMHKLSLGDIARSLDRLLDDQMTGQARLAAHLVAAAEADGRSPKQILRILERVVDTTMLDELWITDGDGKAYLTTVRDASGALVEFAFNPDPGAQPQASKFYQLLSESPDSNAVVVQEAQNREIDWEIFKYVGVNGIDRKRIVQVGNALAFEEQGLFADTYASPVMTAVLAAFGEYDLLDAAKTTRTHEVQTVFEAILAKQMAINATLAAEFVLMADWAGWSAATIDGCLCRIADHSPVKEIVVASHDGCVLNSSLEPAPSGLARLDDTGPLEVGENQVFEHRWETAGDHVTKAVTVFHPVSNCLAQVVGYFDDSQLVSPRYRGLH